jgi:hypothetical protein
MSCVVLADAPLHNEADIEVVAWPAKVVTLAWPHVCLLAPLQTLDKMFERDWQRVCAKEKFTSMLARENKGNAAGKSDKQALQEVHDMLKRHYQVRQACSRGCW